MKKYLSITAVFLVGILLLGGCSREAASPQGTQNEASSSGTGQSQASSGEPEVYNLSDVAMGTLVTETIYTTGEDPCAQVMELLREAEKDYLSWREADSDIGKVNQQAGQGRTEVDEKTMAYLEETLQLSRDSGGAFDPTLGQLSLLWDVESEDPHVPQKKKIRQCLADSGYEKIHLDSSDGCEWAELEEGVSLDLGAVGKGIGGDEASSFLKENPQVQGAVIAVGGSVVTLGSKPDGAPWKVAVRDPRGGEDELLGVLALEGEGYVSTSGDYEKYFMEGDRRYHHILDPSTGYPADSGLISVTALGKDGLISDGLSTACFVLGMEKGRELLEKYQAEGIFVNEEKQVYVTEGLMENFELTADGYIVFPLPS